MPSRLTKVPGTGVGSSNKRTGDVLLAVPRKFVTTRSRGRCRDTSGAGGVWIKLFLSSPDSLGTINCRFKDHCNEGVT